ncbi:hypothetical protein CAPTEDRAFT_185488 [Capitella teleta]|uniref:Uncharacterized protein n=1 Tax=Capitella teleta TaxID=283909 RepID=R7VJH8_CAPTE|nr:hypothetical protein CAPTEDRAFT_185488 [Capitella teleta]|eukprot:ELU16526.1 hypothetical protein CAPTEDRAFT_185488 [Capitella teleta]
MYYGMGNASSSKKTLTIGQEAVSGLEPLSGLEPVVTKKKKRRAPAPPGWSASNVDGKLSKPAAHYIGQETADDLKMKMDSQADPQPTSKFMADIPTHDTSGNPLPAWKRALIAKNLARRLKWVRHGAQKTRSGVVFFDKSLFCCSFAGVRNAAARIDENNR